MSPRQATKKRPKTGVGKPARGLIGLVLPVGCLVAAVVLTGCAQPQVRENANEGQLLTAPRQKGVLTPAAGSREEKAAAEAAERGDFETAAAIYSRIRDREPANGRVTYLLGYVYGQLGERDLEIVLYEQAVGLGYANADVYYNLGIAYFEVDRFDEAIAAFQKGLTDGPESADNRFGLGRVYQYQSRFADAERELLRAVELEPQEPFFREKLALLYEQTGDIDKAAKQLEIILEIDPEYPGVQEYLEHLSKDLPPGGDRPTGVGGD